MAGAARPATSRLLQGARKMTAGTFAGQARSATPCGCIELLKPQRTPVTPEGPYYCDTTSLGDLPNEVMVDIYGFGLSPDGTTLYASLTDTPATNDGQGGVYEFQFANGVAYIGMNEARYDYILGGNQNPIGPSYSGAPHIVVDCDGTIYWMENINGSSDARILKKPVGGPITSMTLSFATYFGPHGFQYNPIDGRLWINTRRNPGIGYPTINTKLIAVDFDTSTVTQLSHEVGPAPLQNVELVVAGDGGVWQSIQDTVPAPDEYWLRRWDPVAETYAETAATTYGAPNVTAGALLPQWDGTVLFTISGTGYKAWPDMTIEPDDCAALLSWPASPAINIPCGPGGGPYAVGRGHSTLGGSVYTTNRTIVELIPI